jgi:hypothetical protein
MIPSEKWRSTTYHFADLTGNESFSRSGRAVEQHSLDLLSQVSDIRSTLGFVSFSTYVHNAQFFNNTRRKDPRRESSPEDGRKLCMRISDELMDKSTTTDTLLTAIQTSDSHVFEFEVGGNCYDVWLAVNSCDPRIVKAYEVPSRRGRCLLALSRRGESRTDGIRSGPLRRALQFDWGFGILEKSNIALSHEDTLRRRVTPSGRIAHLLHAQVDKRDGAD